MTCPQCAERRYVYDMNCERCRARQLMRIPRPLRLPMLAGIRQQEGQQEYERIKPLMIEEHEMDKQGEAA